MQWHFTKRIHLQSGHFQSVLGFKKRTKKREGQDGFENDGPGPEDLHRWAAKQRQ